MKKLYLIILMACVWQVNAQTKFIRNDSIVVKNPLGIPLQNPWAGGLNSVQFSEIDLNFDGYKDLYIFDQTGEKSLTFINKGTPGVSSYEHAPQYQKYFPKGTSWVLLRDMNCDGKEDFLTYYPGGISYYRNISSPGNIQFVLEEKKIQYYNPVVTVKWNDIFTIGVDYPSIDDIDEDGDMDILVYDQFGTSVNYMKNRSMEKYGICDSLDYEIKNTCWGYFTESPTSNTMNLNQYNCWLQVPNPEGNGKGGGTKHTGGTLLSLDLNGDSVKELIVGDISYPNVIGLMNGGQLDSAHMDTQDTAFPAHNNSTIPMNLATFPAMFYLDVNNDSVKDFLASPFVLRSLGVKQYVENAQSVWYYKNNGANQNPDFQYLSNAFLQNGMIDRGEGAYPVFFDHNNDSLLDIVVGNYGFYNGTYFYDGQLALYENTGTKNKPEFKLVDNDYAGLSTMILYTDSMQHTQDVRPTFGDMDNDGDMDMFVGDAYGHIHYFKNTPSGGKANFTIDSINYQNIDVDESAAPFIVDLDRDGLKDLVIGERYGNLNYYRNIGTPTTPSFTLVTDSLGKVDVRLPNWYTGYSAPFFLDNGGKYELYCGTIDGGIRKYTNIDGNLLGTFTKVADTLDQIWEGAITSLSIADIDNDGLNEMVLGNFCGGLSYFNEDIVSTTQNEVVKPLDAGVYPNPSNGNITVKIPGDALGVTLMIHDVSGRLVYEQKLQYSVNNISQPFSPGTYLVTIFNSGKTRTYQTKMIVLEKE